NLIPDAFPNAQGSYGMQTVIADARWEILEDRAAQYIAMLGGSVLRDEKQPDKPIVGVSLADTKVTDADLKSLVDLDHLWGLDLSGTKLTPTSLNALAPLKQLRSLALSRTTLTDATVKQLACLTQLQRLYLDDTNMTDAGLKELAALTRLEFLVLTK